MKEDNEYCEKHCKGYRDTGGRCFADGRCDAYWEYQKQKGTMTIAEIYIGLVDGAKYRRKSWSGTKHIYTDWEKFDRPIVAIHSKDGHEGVYAFNNCDFFANDWEEVQP